MIKWINGKEMFPEGQVPYEELTLTDLEFEDYERAVLTYNYYAREMLIKTEQIIWTPDGNCSRNLIYNVFPTEQVDKIPLLNAYGQKMRNDWKERWQYQEAQCQI